MLWGTLSGGAMLLGHPVWCGHALGAPCSVGVEVRAEVRRDTSVHLDEKGARQEVGHALAAPCLMWLH